MTLFVANRFHRNVYFVIAGQISLQPINIDENLVTNICAAKLKIFLSAHRVNTRKHICYKNSFPLSQLNIVIPENYTRVLNTLSLNFVFTI